MTSKDVKTQSLIQDRITNIETSIQNVSRIRKELDENSVSVKAEVQRSVSVQLNALRQREVQLLRQVDALINHQSAMLQMQLSKLYQVLGRCKATSHWASTHREDCDSFYSNEEELNSISTCHIQYEPAQQRDLSLAIQRFGRLEAKGTARNVFLLPEEEEYGDGDHHILHKTIQADSANKIKVCFPKLSPRSEEWLLDSKKILDEFDLCETSSSSSDKSDSIELLSYPDSDLISIQNDIWLLQTSEKQESCSCSDRGTVEIENLDSLACVPAPMKLSPPSFSIPKVPSICKSSSAKCTTFRECICEESCLVLNLREQLKQQQVDSPIQDCINAAVKEAYELQDWLQAADKIEGTKIFKREPEKWLQELTSETWLAKSSNSPKVEIKKADDVMQKWLIKESVSDHSWLLEPSEKCDKPESESKEIDSWVAPKESTRRALSKQMFNLYFQFESPAWLANQKRNEKDWLIAC